MLVKDMVVWHKEYGSSGILSDEPKIYGQKERSFPHGKLLSWSGRQDSNLRPPGPKPGALPDCATPRKPGISDLRGQRY